MYDNFKNHILNNYIGKEDEHAIGESLGIFLLVKDLFLSI